MDRITDMEMEKEDVAADEPVAAILRASAHSSAKLAGTMERRINTHLILGVLVRWCWFGGVVDELLLRRRYVREGPRPHPLPNGNPAQNHYSAVLSNCSRLFLRQYRIGVEDLKYFKSAAERMRKRIAYSIFDRLDDTRAKLEFAKALMEEKSDSRLASGETTTTLYALDKEQNEMIKGLEVVGDKLEAVAKAFKKEK